MSAFNYVSHCFRPSETIEAVLRLRGRHSYTKAELDLLMREFNRVNGEVIPRPGQTFQVPVLPETESEGGEID